MLAATLQAWDTAARAGFAPNGAAPDPADAASARDQVLLSAAWSGGAADLVATVLDLCRHDSPPADPAGQYQVTGTTRLGLPHVWGVMVDDDAAAWIVGDVFGAAAYPSSLCPHLPIQYQRMDGDLAQWTAGAPPV